MRISDIKPSSAILGQAKLFKKLKSDVPNKSAETS